MSVLVTGDVQTTELVEKARRGDEEAFKGLVLRWQSVFLTAALRLLRYRRHDAEEAVQETWLHIHRGLAALEDSSRWRAWTYRILRNNCLKLMARKSDPPPPPPVEPVLEDSEEKAQRLGRLAAAVQRMPDAYREAVILRFQQKLSYAEIAEALDIAVGTAKSNVARGLLWLEKSLGPSEPTP